MEITTKTDFWLNEDRLSVYNARRFMNARKWHHVRPGFWICADSVVQIEIVPAGQSTAGLVWILTI